MDSTADQSTTLERLSKLDEGIKILYDALATLQRERRTLVNIHIMRYDKIPQSFMNKDIREIEEFKHLRFALCRAGIEKVSDLVDRVCSSPDMWYVSVRQFGEKKAKIVTDTLEKAILIEA